MSEKMFTNHGQAIGTGVAVASFFVALLANWNAIKEHQDLLAWWPVIVIPLAIYAAFNIGRSTQQRATAPTSSTWPTTPILPLEPHGKPIPESVKLPVLTEAERTFRLDEERLVQRKTVKLGDYWEIREGMGRLKITPLSFREIEDRPPYVDLKIDTGGSVFFGGDNAIENGTNRIALKQSSSGFQNEENCAHQFSFSEDHVHFVAIRIDHINKFSSEVVIEVCFVSLHRRFAS